MAEAKTFQCPNCGSPLNVQAEEVEIKCPYCGSAVIVPEELRSHKAPSSPAVSFPTPMYNIPQYNDQISKQVSTVGKVAAGIAISTMIAPIVITLVVFCIVGVFLVFLFWGINSTLQAANPHALQTSIARTIMPALNVIPTDIPFTDTPTDVPTPVRMSTPFSKVLFHDNFSNKKSGWDVADESDYTLAYVKGGYRIFVNQQDVGQTSWIEKNYKDVNVEADIKYVAGPDDGRFGVTCRAKKDAGFYSFEVGTDGWYAIEKYTSDSGHSTSDVLAEGSLDAGALDTTAALHLRGDCVGDTLTLYLNDTPLLQTTDSSFSSGGIGLIANTGSSGEPGVDVLFSNYSVKGR